MAWKEALDGAQAALENAAAELGIDDVKQWAVANGGFENEYVSLALANIGTNVGALAIKGYPPSVLATLVLVIAQLATPPEGNLQ